MQFRDVTREEHYILLRRATHEKKAGDIEAAIATLRKAYTLMNIETQSIDPYLRLPMYLQAAGRTEEALDEFDKLNVMIQTPHLVRTGVALMFSSTIYDKMRLVLQRAGRPEEAVKYGVSSKLSWIAGLRKQGRSYELDYATDAKMIAARMERLLKKAKKPELLDGLVVIVTRHLKTSGHDFGAVGQEVDRLMMK